MKKENKIKSELYRTSFQTQLFIIVLLSFILFAVLDYIIIQYSFNNRYVKNEIESINEEIDNFAYSINKNDTSIINELKSFNSSTGYIPLLVDSGTGGFLLKDSLFSSFIIVIEYENTNYKIKLNDYSIEVKENDIVSCYITETTIQDEYEATYLKINGEVLNDGIYNGNSTIIKDGIVKNIYKPTNLNFLYEGNESTEYGLNLLNSHIGDFNNISASNSSYSSYYKDVENGLIYFLIKPNIYNESSEFLFIIASFVNTNNLLSIVSSYYGYIVVGTVFFAVLIALFISRMFSRPIMKIEKEIIKLADSDFETSNHEFRNKELISLQETINEVKIDTKEKVKSIENQRESLEKLNQELLKENELRSSFIARLSHELKTPLMVIGATTEAMMNGLIDEKDKDEEYNNILNEVDKTTGIIKDIINTYKTSSKEAKLKIERFNLNEIVESVITQTISIAQKNKLVIKKNFAVEAYMDGDKELIRQVVSNFITNAFKYTNEFEKVEINIIDAENSFKFEVKNYGSFISEENLKKIWLPFFRENENIDSSSTGMGLYIVKEILTTHKLEYDVTNFDGGVISYFIIKK